MIKIRYAADKIPQSILGFIFLLTPLAYLNKVFENSYFPKAWVFYFLSLLLALSLLRLQRKQSHIQEKGKPTRDEYHLSWYVVIGTSFIVWMGITSVFAIRPLISLGQFLDFSAKFFLFILVYVNAQRFSIIKTALSACIGMSLVSLIGILQYFGILDGFWRQLLKPASTFVHSNHATHYLSLVIPFALLLIIRAKTKTATFLAAISLFLSLSYAVFTRTRSIWVAWFGALCFIGLGLFLAGKGGTEEKTRGASFSFGRIALALALVFTLGVTFTNPKIFQRVLKKTPSPISEGIEQTPSPETKQRVLGEKSRVLSRNIPRDLSQGFWDRLATIFDTTRGTAKTRIALWSNTIIMILDHPFTGVGPNNFQLIYPLYSHAYMPTPKEEFSLNIQFAQTHNDYLQYTAEMGLVGGLLFFLLALLVPLFTVCHLKNSNSSFRKKAGVVLISSGPIALFIQAGFGFSTLSAGSGHLMWPMTALWLSLVSPQKSFIEPDQRVEKRRHFHISLPISESFKGKLSQLAIVGSAVFSGIMLLVSSGNIIGGRYLVKAYSYSEANRIKPHKSYCQNVLYYGNKAVQYMPFFQTSYRNRALSYSQCNQPNIKTAGQLEKYQKEDPFYPNLLLNLSIFLIDTNNLQKASHALDLYRKIFPKDAKSYVLQGYILQKLGNINESDKWYQQAEKLSTNIKPQIDYFLSKRLNLLLRKSETRSVDPESRRD